MKTVTNQLGRKTTCSFPLKKNVSFVPAITDTLFSLRLQNEIVGRTRFCIHPKGIVEKGVNGSGTKDLKLERIHELNPDLIIIDKEENTKEMVEQLEAYYPVFAFEVQTVTDAFQIMESLGSIVNRTRQADALIQDIQKAFSSFPSLYKGKRAAYVIWQNPYIVAGNNTYIQSLLDKLGFINPFTEFEGRYPTITEDDFKKAKLDYVLLATEPFPFQENHLPIFEKMTNGSKTIIANREMFYVRSKNTRSCALFQTTFSKITYMYQY